jgi:hypothetical protein
MYFSAGSAAKACKTREGSALRLLEEFFRCILRPAAKLANGLFCLAEKAAMPAMVVKLPAKAKQTHSLIT